MQEPLHFFVFKIKTHLQDCHSPMGFVSDIHILCHSERSFGVVEESQNMHNIFRVRSSSCLQVQTCSKRAKRHCLRVLTRCHSEERNAT